MRSKEEIEKEIKELNEEHNERIDELNEELKNIKSAIPWKPEVGDACFCLASYKSNLVQIVYSSSDKYSFDNGYIVKTLDEAQRKQARDRIHKQLKDLATQAGRRDGEFIFGVYNYFITFYASTECIDFNIYQTYQFPDIVYFPDEPSVRNAIDTIGREKLKYAYFGGSRVDE